MLTLLFFQIVHLRKSKFFKKLHWSIILRQFLVRLQQEEGTELLLLRYINKFIFQYKNDLIQKNKTIVV